MIQEDDSYNVGNDLATATVCNLVGTQHQSKNLVGTEKSLGQYYY